MLNNIKMSCEYLGQSSHTVEGLTQSETFYQDDWKVVLRYKGNRLTTDFHVGTGWHGEEPKVKDVLYCLVSDHYAYTQSDDVEDFARNFGYDTDTPEGLKHARKVYKACKSISTKMTRMFTQDEIVQLRDILND